MKLLVDTSRPCKRLIFIERAKPATIGRWKSNDREIVAHDREILAHLIKAIRGLTSTLRSKSDGGRRVDHEIVVHDHHVIEAKNRLTPDQTALIFCGNSSLKTDVLLFFS